MSDAATMTAPAIFGALVRIQSEMGGIAKTGRGPASQGAYPFMPVDAIVARLGELLTEHGVAVIGNQVECEQATYRFPKVNMDGQPVYDGRADAFQIITRLRYEFTFISAADGSSVTAAAYGESADTGDKGIRRAATAAYKEVLLRTFTITSGEDDPDSLHPGDEPAQVVRQDRGAQARERASRGKTERAPRAPRGTVTETAADKAAAEEAPEQTATVEEAAPSGSPATAPEDTTPAGDAAEEKPATLTAAERRAAAAARRKPAEKQAEPEPQPEPEPAAAEPEFQVDPADVAHAEATQPKAREPKAPVEKPEPVTQADEKYQSVADVRTAIRDALTARGLDREYANGLGDEVTGKQRGQWFASLPDLRKVLKAIEAGEAPGDDEAGF